MKPYKHTKDKKAPAKKGKKPVFDSKNKKAPAKKKGMDDKLDDADTMKHPPKKRKTPEQFEKSVGEMPM